MSFSLMQIYFLSKIFSSVRQVQFCLSHFGTVEELLNAKPQTLKNAKLKEAQIAKIRNPDWKIIEAELKTYEKINAHIVSYFDEDYPMLLKEISDPPLLLYVRGDKNLLSLPQIAMVGTRHPTVTATETARQFASHLAKSGFVITSGLASGIDRACHEGALFNGKTIAVMGTGINQIYPRTHQKLAEKILENGALVSEFSFDEKPKANHFPKRNRIISGLSIGTLVVEAAMHSGSLITARFASEQGREVFAIPGSIHNPLSRGCHHLIREGAKLVETAEDILEELSGLLETFQPLATTPILEKNNPLLEKIGYEPTSFDTIIIRSGLTAAEVSSILLSLELSGEIQSVPGGYIRSC